MDERPHHLAVEDGLFVNEVERGSIAAKAGILPGDIIISLARSPVRSLKEFGQLLPQINGYPRVRMGVIRGQQLGVALLELR